MGLKNILFTILFAAGIGFFIQNCCKLIKYLSVAKKKDDRFGEIGERIKRVIIVAFGHSKLFRDPKAGILHFFIFWGFILFLIAILEAFVQGFYSPFSLAFTGRFYSVVTFIEDIFGALVILSVLYALFRRFIVHIPRLEVEKSGKSDAAAILLMIMFVCISMFGENTAMIAIHGFSQAQYEYHPISAILSPIFYSPYSLNAMQNYELFWWMHIIVVLTFLNYLPYSKHFHIITSIPNVFFSNLSAVRNTLKPLNLEDESIEVYGVGDIEQFSWKQLLDGYSCTECGRCTDSCPAATVGKSLSPRKIVVEIRRRTSEKAPLLAKGIFEGKTFEKTLIHDYISDTELWECTTCMACVQECPVMIEHIDSIIDMRRDLVLTESVFPPNLKSVFKSIETNFTPWAFNSADRANWAEGMGIKTMAEDRDCDILFWVGCAGSFDNRYKKVTKAFASIMQKANINFRILGNEEKCNGDTARRLGNEYLAQVMIKENIETLNGYGVKKIVTACPHCFHSLKNEYKQFGGNYEVVHHSQFIQKLLNDGSIKLKDDSKETKITYHDSCYLGRYNGVYDSPRESLKQVNGLEIVEMKRNKSKGFCCGAGGGRMFLEDEEGGSINIERTREALETNTGTIASACPFCMTMLTDGVKHFEKSDQVEIKDIAEIIL
ncbi:MAG: (Fe-S)-binding protein, partial [Ignavibacteriaceae bacterium]|nr:(Fe-S)-binding protein [Ignavibacteriaceae bacterium]